MRVAATGKEPSTGSVSELLMPVDLNKVVLDALLVPLSVRTTLAIKAPSARLATLAV